MLIPMTNGSSCWFSGIVLSAGKTLTDVKNMAAALKEKGIEARPFWKPVHLQEPYREVPRRSVDIAEALWERILCLPCSTNITEEELACVAEGVKEILCSGRK